MKHFIIIIIIIGMVYQLDLFTSLSYKGFWTTDFRRLVMSAYSRKILGQTYYVWPIA